MTQAECNLFSRFIPLIASSCLLDCAAAFRPSSQEMWASRDLWSAVSFDV